MTRIFWEKDVTVSSGLGTSNAYDLFLCPDRAAAGRGVLKVKIVLQFQFKSGITPSGQPLGWRPDEKEMFVAEFGRQCREVWDNRWRITTDSPVPHFRDIRVQFEIESHIDGFRTSDHWELVTTKSLGMQASGVDGYSGKCLLDSNDFRVKTFEHDCDPDARYCVLSTHQRGAVHEFGHMLGLKDEYPTARHVASHWSNDVASVMNCGEEVRERHYAPFADWLTEKYAFAAKKSGMPIEYKVNGECDCSNAYLD